MVSGIASTIQCSPQPVNRNLMSRLASPLLTVSPTCRPPCCTSSPFLKFSVHPISPSVPPFQVFLEAAQPENQYSALGSLATDKVYSIQLDRQSLQLLSVGWKEPRHLCLVWSQRERWEHIKWNTYTV